MIFLAVIAFWVAVVIGMAVWRHNRTWLTQGIVVRRWQYFVTAAVVGVGIAVAILVSAKALRDLAHERDARAKGIAQETQTRIEGELLTRDDVTHIARRVFRLEKPTNEDQVRRLTTALRLLLTNPTFQRRFGVKAVRLTTPPPTVDVTTIPKVKRKKKTTARKPTRRPSSGGQPSPSPSPPPPSPPPSKPPVNIHTPSPIPVVTICTGVIAINCDRLTG